MGLKVVREEAELPNKLKNHLYTNGPFGERFVLGVKTQYRLSPDYPYCWLVVTSHRSLVCSTHRSGIHHEYSHSEMNAAAAGEGAQLRLLPNDLDDLILPLPKSEVEEVEELVREINRAVTGHETS